MAKIDLPTRIPTSYRLIASLSTFDYYKKDKLFSKNDKPSFNSKDERFVKHGTFLFVPLNYIGYGKLQDNYFSRKF